MYSFILTMNTDLFIHLDKVNGVHLFFHLFQGTYTESVECEQVTQLYNSLIHYQKIGHGDQLYCFTVFPDDRIECFVTSHISFIKEIDEKEFTSIKQNMVDALEHIGERDFYCIEYNGIFFQFRDIEKPIKRSDFPDNMGETIMKGVTKIPSFNYVTFKPILYLGITSLIR